MLGNGFRGGVDALKKEVGGIAAVIVTIIVLVTIILVGPWNGGQNLFYNPEESLPHLASPAEIPGDQVNATVIGDLSLSVTGFFYTISTHSTPTTLNFDLDIIVNNTGASSIDDFQVVKVTVYYENATPVYTFGVEPDENSTIPADSTLTLEYENDRDMISVPWSLISASYVFARVLIIYDGNTEIILTTPMTELPHAME